MEGLHCLKFPLEQDDLLCKIDLKEAYFSVPLNKNLQKFLWFQWSCNLDEFLCLCFGLGPAPRIFTKSIKVPIALLRRVNIRIIIYLDDMLLMGRTLPEIFIARDKMIFQLQQIKFSNYVRARSPRNVISILWIKLEKDLILPTLPLRNTFFLV